MSAEQRTDNRNAGKRARYAEAKLAKQHAAAATAEASARSAIAAVVADLIDDVVGQSELDAVEDDERIALERWLRGDELSYDTLCDWRGSHEYECFEADRDAEAWEAAGRPASDKKQQYCMPWLELKTRLDEGLGPLRHEPQEMWDARVAAARVERGIPLGDYLMSIAIIAFEFLTAKRAPWRDKLPAERERQLPRPPDAPPPPPPPLPSPSSKSISSRLSSPPESEDFDTYVDEAYALQSVGDRLATDSGRVIQKQNVHPPRRCEYDPGEKGRKAYHDARSVWYMQRTGVELTGTTAQQEELFDNACRYLRARGGSTDSNIACSP